MGLTGLPRLRPGRRRRGVRRLLPEGVARLDLRAFRAVAGWHPPGGDPVLVRLSRSADHGVLWIGVAGALAAVGGRAGRRAALRGMVAVGVASAVANLPAKMALRRGRPPLDLVPTSRHLPVVPTTWSLPSGHSASAAAFAVGVAMEHRAAGVVVAPVAAGVAFSRVYTGVHYPGDVLAGIGLGIAAAAVTTRWWPRRPPDDAPVEQPTIEAPALADGAGLHVVVNQASGGSEGLAGEVRAALPGAVVEEVAPDEIGDVLAGIEPGQVAALGVVGGDGTVRSVAARASDLGLPLVVIPGGTFDHFARDLGVVDVAAAAAAVQAGEAVRVAMAEAGPHAFLNVASLGAYSDLVDARERLEHRIGKYPAMVVGLSRVLASGEPLDVDVDGERQRVWLLFAGNGRFAPEGVAPAWRPRLDDDHLDLRMVDGHAPFARTRLVIAVLTGRLSRCRAYKEWRAESVSVRSDEPLRVAVDGETLDGGADLVLRSRGSIVVYRPAPGSSMSSMGERLP